MNGLGSLLPGVATPRGRRSQHRLYIFQQNSIANIYFSRTASPVYTPTEQHSMFVYAPWEWRPLGVAARHPMNESDSPCPNKRLYLFSDSLLNTKNWLQIQTG